MKISQFLNETFVDDAHAVHQDHEVQMAREELYHAAEYALRLHKLLRNVDERQGLEGWVSSKITLANDYLKTVLEYMEYELMTAATQPEQVDAMAIAENAPMERESDEWLKTATDKEIWTYAHETEGYNYHADDLYDALKQRQQKLLGVAGQREKEINDRLKSKLRSNYPKITAPMRGAITKLREAPSNYTADEIVSILSGSKTQAQVDADRKAAQQQTTTTQQPTPQSTQQVKEMSTGSVATLVNPPAKNKAKVGVLFGGTYKQSKAKK